MSETRRLSVPKAIADTNPPSFGTHLADMFRRALALLVLRTASLWTLFGDVMCGIARGLVYAVVFVVGAGRMPQQRCVFHPILASDETPGDMQKYIAWGGPSLRWIPDPSLKVRLVWCHQDGGTRVFSSSSSGCRKSRSETSTDTSDGRKRRFLWTLERQRRPPDTGKWLIYGVLSSDVDGKLTMEG